LIEDNYNGVTLWENAYRYCGSPANTSSGYLHLGEFIGCEALDLQLLEHLEGAVLLGLPLEDTERQGAATRSR
jgi:hypothetical protein